MEACDVKEILKKSYEDPCFYINFHNVGRGIVGDDNDEGKPYIRNTKTLNRWRIVDDKLEKVEDEQYEILFDAETYINQWTFEYSDENATIHEDTLFYYWKGSNASKGYSPLPPEIENQNPVVERISQWSEPALFFHMFSKCLVVFRGSQDKFNPSLNRLFIVRGELPSEVHLYEVPCSKESLRSRGIFQLLSPSENTVYYWYGAAVPKQYQQIASLIKFNTRNEHWANYKTVVIKDGCGDNLFLDLLEGQADSYIRSSPNSDFSPRLFYFNSITGDFLATEVEYPLKSKEYKAAFPFLQSHLYTADQPALFLLDNDKEIWLWEGWKTPESNLELFEKELQLAKETADNYVKEKHLSIPVKHVLAGLEPLDFINIFPYWNKRSDIAKIQLK